MMANSRKDLATLTTLSHYAQPLGKTGQLESYDDIMDRVIDMHVSRVKELCVLDADNQDMKGLHDQLEDLLTECRVACKQKKVFPAGRSMQFGGDSILTKHPRIFNCCGTFFCQPDIFWKSVYLLLCGCGVGGSLQRHHVERLPPVHPVVDEVLPFTISDSIEGWADAFKALFCSYFRIGEGVGGHRVLFDYRQIRPKGARISNLTGKAPGPGPLRISLEQLRTFLDAYTADGPRKLRPIDIFDIMGFCAECVLAGGVRRSALLFLFSEDDTEMMTSKTGDWYVTNPQRARANISVIVKRVDMTEEKMQTFCKYARDSGEPGLIMSDSLETITNPCAEIGLYPYDPSSDSYGFEACNLTEINAVQCLTDDAFLHAAKCAAILGTLQATYTDWAYVGEPTKTIMERSSLLGVSITGIMENSKVLNAALLERGVAVVKKWNDRVAKLIGINPGARLTTIKPSGTASVCLELGACGIHPSHAQQYIRRVQISEMDELGKFYTRQRPKSSEASAWSKGSNAISFPIQMGAGCVTKQDMSAISLLTHAAFVQKHWVKPGIIASRNRDHAHIQHNVSLTINVGAAEWDGVAKFVYEHREQFTGITMLSNTGDVDYQQAPFERILTGQELLVEFGESVLFASGLIVDVIREFSSLHSACTALMYPDGDERKLDDVGHRELESYHKKRIVLDRIRKFANKYFDGDVLQTITCLKRVNGLYTYKSLQTECVDEIDWGSVRVDVMGHTDRQSERKIDPVCSGSGCVLERL
jgi:ribonucleoside-diphosphate reductase alpha chain